MSIDAAYELVKTALALGMIIAGPFIIGALVVGLLVSLLQTITTVQEATLSFLPKLLFAVGATWFMTPWVLEKFSVFTVDFFRKAADIVR